MSRNPTCGQGYLAWQPALPYLARYCPNEGRHPREIVTFRGTEPIVLQRIIETAAPKAATGKSPRKADVKIIVPAGLPHQAGLSPGAARAAAPVRHRTRGHRGRRRVVGCRAVHRQSR